MNKEQKDNYKMYYEYIIKPLGNITADIGKVFFGMAKDAGKAGYKTCKEKISKAIEESKINDTMPKKKKKDESFSFSFDIK